MTAETATLLQRIHQCDIGILRAIFEGRNPACDPVFTLITDATAYIAFGIPLILIGISFFKKNPVLRRNAWNVVLPVALSAILANILKYSLDLPRPFEIYPYIEQLSTGGSPSFPSGHTADAFAFAVALSLVHRKWPIALLSLAWASLIGYTRMRLGVHFPSDVLGGALIGTSCALIWHRFMSDRILPGSRS
jgi:membrane-associated phospholipid phosphatase